MKERLSKVVFVLEDEIEPSKYVPFSKGGLKNLVFENAISEKDIGDIVGAFKNRDIAVINIDVAKNDKADEVKTLVIDMKDVKLIYY